MCPCLFAQNVPPGQKFDPGSVAALYIGLSGITSVPVEHIEVHIENTQYGLLRPDGTYAPTHGVHVFVEWFGGRSRKDKRRVARAIQTFLIANGLGTGSDITFRDSPAVSFFYEGEEVPGGPPEIEDLGSV